MSALIAYVGAVTGLLSLPGPDWAFVLAVGTRDRVVVPAAAGLSIGYVVMALVVAAGVAPLVAAAPAALTAIAVAGACYLVHLGLAILRHSGRDEHVSSTAGVTGGAGRLLRHGIGVSALNPKSLVLFVAFLPQFARPSAPWPLGVQLAVLGLVWAAMSAVFYTALGRTAHKVFGARPRASRAVTRLAGAAMVVGGIALVGDQLLHAR